MYNAYDIICKYLYIYIYMYIYVHVKSKKCLSDQRPRRPLNGIIDADIIKS